jgi:hypothetical protein
MITIFLVSQKGAWEGYPGLHRRVVLFPLYRKYFFLIKETIQHIHKLSFIIIIVNIISISITYYHITSLLLLLLLIYQ